MVKYGNPRREERLATPIDQYLWTLWTAARPQVDIRAFAQYVAECRQEGKECRFNPSGQGVARAVSVSPRAVA